MGIGYNENDNYKVKWKKKLLECKNLDRDNWILGNSGIIKWCMW